MLKKLRAVGGLLAAGALFGTCGTGPGASVSMSFTGGPASPAQSRFAAFAVAGGLGAQQITYTSIEIVLREIELERQETADCDTAADVDACEEFETGPFLVTVPLGAEIVQAFSIDATPGTYDEVEFDIHKVSSGDPADAAFLAAHPDLADISIRAKGTYNGQPFEYTTDLNEEQEYALVPPLVIGENGTPANVTVRIDYTGWFLVGGVEVDPNEATKAVSLRTPSRTTSRLRSTPSMTRTGTAGMINSRPDHAPRGRA